MPALAALPPSRAHVGREFAASIEDDTPAPFTGTAFTAIGNFVSALLVSLGLTPGQLVVDVGCGGGWLVPQLASFPRLRYLGTDVSADLLDHARELAHCDHWRFVRAPGDAIPCAGEAADFVCFSSLFAHLLSHDAVRYLAEARRVLLPAGRIVFPFFDFALDRGTIVERARLAGLRVDRIAAADQPLIPLDELFPWPLSRHLGASRCLGQSVAVLSLPSAA